MNTIEDDINNVIADGQLILKKNIATEKDLISFRKKSDSLFSLLIKKNIDSLINELANIGFRSNIKKFDNKVIQWIYNQLTEGKNDITYNAPFLKKKTNSDYFKTDIFWTIQKLEGILYNLEIISKR